MYQDLQKTLTMASSNRHTFTAILTNCEMLDVGLVVDDKAELAFEKEAICDVTIPSLRCQGYFFLKMKLSQGGGLLTLTCS